jgi:hypothetical protein
VKHANQRLLSSLSLGATRLWRRADTVFAGYTLS